MPYTIWDQVDVVNVGKQCGLIFALVGNETVETIYNGSFVSLLKSLKGTLDEAENGGYISHARNVEAGHHFDNIVDAVTRDMPGNDTSLAKMLYNTYSSPQTNNHTQSLKRLGFYFPYNHIPGDFKPYIEEIMLHDEGFLATFHDKTLNWFLKTKKASLSHHDRTVIDLCKRYGVLRAVINPFVQDEDPTSDTLPAGSPPKQARLPQLGNVSTKTSNNDECCSGGNCIKWDGYYCGVADGGGCNTMSDSCP